METKSVEELTRWFGPYSGEQVCHCCFAQWSRQSLREPWCCWMPPARQELPCTGLAWAMFLTLLLSLASRGTADWEPDVLLVWASALGSKVLCITPNQLLLSHLSGLFKQSLSMLHQISLFYIKAGSQLFERKVVCLYTGLHVRTWDSHSEPSIEYSNLVWFIKITPWEKILILSTGISLCILKTFCKHVSIIFAWYLASLP